jgi:hypothetical protein
MVPKLLVSTVFCAALLVSGSASAADAYRPDEFFTLDLAKAVLSPKRLGPPTEFAPVAVEAKSHEPAWARRELKTEPKQVVAQRVKPAPVQRMVQAPRPHGVARARIARRHGNPLDAQAFDTRIQVWPCRSGGICNWKPAR